MSRLASQAPATASAKRRWCRWAAPRRRGADAAGWPEPVGIPPARRRAGSSRRRAPPPRFHRQGAVSRSRRDPCCRGSGRPCRRSLPAPPGAGRPENLVAWCSTLSGRQSPGGHSIQRDRRDFDRRVRVAVRSSGSSSREAIASSSPWTGVRYSPGGTSVQGSTARPSGSVAVPRQRCPALHAVVDEDGTLEDVSTNHGDEAQVREIEAPPLRDREGAEADERDLAQ